MGGGGVETAAVRAGRVALPAEPPPALPARAQLDEVRVVTGWLASDEGRAAAIDLDRAGRARILAWASARVAAGPLFGATLRSGDRSASV